MGCSQRIGRKIATATRMYAALDLHKESIQCVLKDDDGRVIKESKLGKRRKDTRSGRDKGSRVMELGFNHQHIYDVLKERGCDVTVARPLMVKAIAYAKVKTDIHDEPFRCVRLARLSPAAPIRSYVNRRVRCLVAI